MTFEIDAKAIINEEFEQSEIKFSTIQPASKEYLRIIPKDGTLDVVVSDGVSLTDAAREFIIAVTKMLPIELTENNTPRGYSVILFCAFRYALGRRTYVVDSVVQAIHDYWRNLTENDKNIFTSEILEHNSKFGNLGMDMDKTQWLSIVERYEAEKAK